MIFKQSFLLTIFIYFTRLNKVFRLKENVYVTEFELINLDESGSIGMAAVLSDSSAVYIFSDSTNVRFFFFLNRLSINSTNLSHLLFLFVYLTALSWNRF